MLHEMVMQKFNLETNAVINLSFKLSSFDFAVDITNDSKVESCKRRFLIFNTSLAETYRAMVQEWYYKRRQLAANMTYEITASAANKVAKKRMKSATWVVNGVNAYQYEVSDGQYIREVNLQTGICGCHKWQLSGLPCGHPFKDHGSWYEYCSARMKGHGLSGLGFTYQHETNGLKCLNA
nr:transposase, MuDR, MULE transposase domain protein [Tanacetum cinerariifolium]